MSIRPITSAHNNIIITTVAIIFTDLSKTICQAADVLIAVGANG